MMTRRFVWEKGENQIRGREKTVEMRSVSAI